MSLLFKSRQNSNDKQKKSAYSLAGTFSFLIFFAKASTA